MSSLYDEILANDKKRLDIRKSYKLAMAKGEAGGPFRAMPNDYIYFPKSLISNNNEQLRKGLSWLYNGFILKYGDDVIAVDPGVNFVLRLSEDGFNLSSINYVFVSHLHLDHSADVNFLMDWKIRAQSEATIFAPKSVFDSGTVSDFHSGREVRFPIAHNSKVVDESSIEQLKGGSLQFVKLFHGVECYGFKYTAKKTITYISDTGYAKTIREKEVDITIDDVNEIREKSQVVAYRESIKKFAEGSDVLIVNIDSFGHAKNSKTHMSVVDLLHVLSDSNVKQVVLAHINPMGELDYSEWGATLAEYVAEQSGLPTTCSGVAGMTVEL